MWHVYIVKGSEGCLYTGIANNLENRIKQYNRGCGCKFTKPRIPVTLVYCKWRSSRGRALTREAAIKRLTRNEKLELIGK
ncbi:MAG: GIY-YIG nuclease family protein [Candidatus Omnitrophota bacterium]